METGSILHPCKKNITIKIENTIIKILGLIIRFPYAHGKNKDLKGLPFVGRAGEILDDLDRCLPDRALELLESIKNLFVVDNADVIFISGIDTDVVKKFINQKYHNI